jgi:hypothetical protein
LVLVGLALRFMEPVQMVEILFSQPLPQLAVVADHLV